MQAGLETHISLDMSGTVTVVWDQEIMVVLSLPCLDLTKRTSRPDIASRYLLTTSQISQMNSEYSIEPVKWKSSNTPWHGMRNAAFD